jgi:hypothetical protein
MAIPPAPLYARLDLIGICGGIGFFWIISLRSSRSLISSKLTLT